jgi:hypothetical protein
MTDAKKATRNDVNLLTGEICYPDHGHLSGDLVHKVDLITYNLLMVLTRVLLYDVAAACLNTKI